MLLPPAPLSKHRYLGTYCSTFHCSMAKHRYLVEPSFLEPSILRFQMGFQFVLCRVVPVSVLKGHSHCVSCSPQMPLLPPGYPVKCRWSTGDMADGVLVGPLPLGDSFISITAERGGSVVHQDCAPLANITFPIAVCSPPDSP